MAFQAEQPQLWEYMTLIAGRGPRMDILRSGCGPTPEPCTSNLPVYLVSGRCSLSLNLYSRFLGVGTTNSCERHCIPGVGLSLPLPCPRGSVAKVQRSPACAVFLP